MQRTHHPVPKKGHGRYREHLAVGNGQPVMRNEPGEERAHRTGERGYEKKYHELIAEGRRQNMGTAHKYAKEDEAALLNRLEKYSHNHLLFLHNFTVPFDDNGFEESKEPPENGRRLPKRERP